MKKLALLFLFPITVLADEKPTTPLTEPQAKPAWKIQDDIWSYCMQSKGIQPYTTPDPFFPFKHLRENNECLKKAGIPDTGKSFAQAISVKWTKCITSQANTLKESGAPFNSIVETALSACAGTFIQAVDTMWLSHQSKEFFKTGYGIFGMRPYASDLIIYSWAYGEK